MKVIGKSVELPNERVVFVGHNDETDETHLGFINSQGSEQRFRLSVEAVDALRRLLNNEVDVPDAPFPSRQAHWVQVR